MGLLSRLRQQADQLRLDRAGSAEALSVKRDRVERAMRTIPAYFDEIKEHLETLRPLTPRTYALESLTLGNLRLGEFYFNSRLMQVLDREVFDYHIFSFAYRSDQQFDILRNSRHDIDALEKMLQRARIPFDLALSRDSDHRVIAGRFQFSLKFRGGLRFQADPENAVVAVMFRNIDRLDAFELEFEPEELSEELFDRIVGFVLGETESHTLGGRVRFRKPQRVYAPEDAPAELRQPERE